MSCAPTGSAVALGAIVDVDAVAELEVLRSIVPPEMPFLVIGAGSNLLVSDSGFPGIVLRLTDAFATIEFGERGPGRHLGRRRRSGDVAARRSSADPRRFDRIRVGGRGARLDRWSDPYERRRSRVGHGGVGHPGVGVQHAYRGTGRMVHRRAGFCLPPQSSGPRRPRLVGGAESSTSATAAEERTNSPRSCDGDAPISPAVRTPVRCSPTRRVGRPDS